jgi:hypothetical protein
MPPAFADIHRAIKSGAAKEFLALGGRGGGKSSWASEEGVLAILRNPNIHGLVLRKVGTEIGGSTFNQYLWAIDALGVADKFRVKKSPYELTYIPTEQKIYFRGVDNPRKIKSIKMAFGYFGFVHYEEFDEFAGEEEIRSINQSAIRGGDNIIRIKTFNPPRNPYHWANVYASRDTPGQIVHQSSYLDMPREWIGNDFIEEAELLKTRDYLSYEHEYLGVANGSGKSVFDTQKLQAQIAKRVQPKLVGIINKDGVWQNESSGWIKIYFEPIPGRPYVIGVDTSGAGSDYTAAQILDNITGRQVAVLHRQVLDEHEMVSQLIGLGNMYNNALICVEANFSTYVPTTLSERGYHRQYVREREDNYTGKHTQAFGFLTTAKSKERIVSAMIEEFDSKPENVVDNATLVEMMSFTRNEAGRAEADKGANDDLVMSINLANEARGQQTRIITDTSAPVVPAVNKDKWNIAMKRRWSETPDEFKEALLDKWRREEII